MQLTSFFIYMCFGLDFVLLCVMTYVACTFDIQILKVQIWNLYFNGKVFHKMKKNEKVHHKSLCGFSPLAEIFNVENSGRKSRFLNSWIFKYWLKIPSNYLKLITIATQNWIQLLLHLQSLELVVLESIFSEWIKYL